MNTGERLKEARQKIGLTQKQFGENINTSQAKIKDIETNAHKLKVEIADKIAHKYAINPWWLLTGQGSMYQKDTIEEDTITIKKYDVLVSAGYGTSGQNEEANDIQVPISFLHSFGITETKNLEIIKAYGNSMYPTIEDDDDLIIQRGSKLIDDYIYIFRYEDELFVKRLAKSSDGIIAISDNPKYGEKVYKRLEVIGKVLASFKNFSKKIEVPNWRGCVQSLLNN